MSTTTIKSGFPGDLGRGAQSREGLTRRLGRWLGSGAQVSDRQPKRLLARLILLSVAQIFTPELERARAEHSLHYGQFRPTEFRSSSKESLALSVTGIDRIQADWEALQERAPVSPYQRFDFTAAWIRHAASGAGVIPRIGVVRDELGRVVMIVPFGLVQQLGTTVGVYLGGAHFNVNMPLVDPDLRLEPETIGRLLDEYCQLTGADVLLLNNQPRGWRGTRHPFLSRPHYAAPDNIRVLEAEGGYENYLAQQLKPKIRSELKRKMIRFNEAGRTAFKRATTAEEVDRFLAALIDQKSKRLAAQGLDDPFGFPGVKDFLREAALSGLSGTGGMEIHALEVNDRPQAVRAGIRDRDHFSFMIVSFDTDSALSRYSPTECLLAEMLNQKCGDGVASFDFGVGDGRPKRVWSNEVLPLFSVTHAVTKRGQLYASLMKLTAGAIRYVKRNPRLFSAVQDARALSARLRGQRDA